MDVASSSRIESDAHGHVDAARGPVVYAFDGCRLAVGPRELSRGGRAMPMPSRVFDCLVYLVEHRDRAVGRDELVAAIWGRIDVSDAQLGQIVLRARRAVGDDGHGQRFIRTMPKFGYRWTAPVEVSAPDTWHASPLDPPPMAAAATDAAPPRRKPLLALLATALLAATAFGTAQPRGGTGIGPPGEQVAIVLPVDVAALPGDEWIRLGGMDVLAARLRAGGLQVPASDGTLALLASTEGAGGVARLRRSDTGAWIVRVSLVATSPGWRAELAASSARGISLRAGGVGPEPLSALRQAGDGLLLQLGPDAHAAPDGSKGPLRSPLAGMPAIADRFPDSLQRME